MALAIRGSRLPSVADLVNDLVQDATADRLRWNAAAQRYYDPASGRFLPKTYVTGVMHAEVEASKGRMLRAGRDLQAGLYDLNQFRAIIAHEAKLNLLANTAAGRGGFAHMRAADYANAERLLARQLHFLERFMRQADRSPAYVATPGFLNRLSMYGDYGRAAYEATRTQAHREAGYEGEFNILHAAESCEGGGSCVEETARGVVPIGDLIEVGARQCLTRCKCTKGFTDTLAED